MHGRLQGVYGSHDYFPAVVADWLGQDFRTVLGVEVDGSVVAAETVTVVDGGTTVVTQALRVAEAYALALACQLG